MGDIIKMRRRFKVMSNIEIGKIEDYIIKGDTIRNAVLSYKNRALQGEGLKGELCPPSPTRSLEELKQIIPDELGRVLYWDDLLIEGNSVYAILSEQSYELLNEDFPNEAWSFLLRAHYKLNTRQENDKIIQEITELNVLAIDKYEDKSTIIFN